MRPEKNNKLPYVVAKDVNAPDGEEGTGGGGGGGTKQKRLTKQALKDPLGDLVNALESLYKVLVVNEDLDKATHQLENEVTNRYKTIEDIVNHHVYPEYGNDDADDDEISDSDGKAYEGKIELKRLFYSDSDSNNKGNGGKGEEREHRSRTEESEDDDDNGDSENKDDHAAEVADADDNNELEAEPSHVDGSENALDNETNEETEVEIEENDAEGNSQLQTQPEPEQLHDNMKEAQ